MKPLFTVLGLAFILIAGCAPKTQFILLPDPDGKVGSLEVTSQGGTQVVDQAGYVTEISSANKKPSKPKKMNTTRIETVFSRALAVEPLPVDRFVLYFTSGGTRLTDESQALLVKIYTSIEQRNSKDISIVGHTDKVGSDRYNRKLSLARATVLGKLLEAKGVLSDHMEIASHGEMNPLIETADGIDEPRNRRVEIVVR